MPECLADVFGFECECVGHICGRGLKPATTLLFRAFPGLSPGETSNPADLAYISFRPWCRIPSDPRDERFHPEVRPSAGPVRRVPSCGPEPPYATAASS